MSISTRQVKNKRDGNGALTGKAGVVYDVNVKYQQQGKWRTHMKKGFVTKKEAVQYEAEMRTKLASPSYSPIDTAKGKQTVQEYMETWVEQHGKANLRPSTFDGYKGYIRNHIVPHIGYVQLRALTPALLDEMFQKMFDEGLSQSSVRYTQRILSVALEAARKYRYIDHNPARDILTKFGKQGKTPDPYTIPQMQQLFGLLTGTEWEMIVMPAGMYGMRMSEILGLRWRNVNLEKGYFAVVEQLPFKLPAGTTEVSEMAPVKGRGADGSGERTLPITDVAREYFERQLELQERQRRLALNGGGNYYENDLVNAKPNGAPNRRDGVSANFAQLIRCLDMPHLRFHDLRHSAATNMHQLTGDFYTVGMILGHSLKGTGLQLGISTNLEAMTAQYVDVRLERKKFVLDAYHNALFPKEDKDENQEARQSGE